MPQLLFEMPAEPIQLAQIVRAIPDDFSWIDGYLLAPKKLYDQECVARNTRLVLTRFDSIQPTIIGADDKPYEENPNLTYRRDGEPRIQPNYIDLFVNKGLVSSLSFNEAGFDGRPQLKDIKRLIEHFLLKGYKGRIAARRRIPDEVFEMSEEVYFDHTPYNAHYFTPDLPAHLCLKWGPENGGKIATLSELVKGIERLNLKQIHVETKPR